MNNYSRVHYDTKVCIILKYHLYIVTCGTVPLKKHLARKQQSVLEPVEWSDLLNSALL